MMATAVSKMAHYAQGGKVGGKGAGDKVRALLDPREVVLPPDTVKAVGLTTLKALIAATHKPTGKGKGGRIRRMADGGLVGFAQDSAAETADALRRKNYADAAGQAIRGSLALPGVALGAAGADALSGIVRPVGNALYTAATGNNTGGASPAVTAMSAPTPKPAVAPPYSPALDSQAAYPVGQVPVPNGYTGPAGNALASDPTVRKSVDASGNALYSNQTPESDAALMARGQPSAQNMRAVDALAARYAGNDSATAQYNQQVADANATNAQPARADTGGFGLLDKSVLAARNAQVGVEKPLTRQAVQLAIASGQSATSRANAETEAASRLAGSNIAAQASKYGADTSAGTAAARLATETPEIEAKTKLTTQQVVQQQKLQDLQKKYLAATDPVERRQLYEALIASQGHIRSLAEKYTVIPQGSQVDPATGLITHNPSKLFDNQLGKEIELSEPTSGAGTAKQQLPAGLVVGAATKQADGVYSAAGKTITIKGGKVTAIQ